MGRAVFCCITQLDKIHADYKYLITRGDFPSIKNVPYLKVFSPSDGLHKKLCNLSGNPELLRSTLESEFTKEKQNDPVYQYMKRQIIKRMQQGKTFCFACCCPKADYCHRSLVAKDFTESGIEVELL